MIEHKSLALGIDLGGTNIRIGVVDSQGKVLDKITVPTHVELGSQSIIKTLVKETQILINKFDKNSFSAIGVAVAGQVDSKTGSVLFGPNLFWKNIPLAYELSKELNISVFVGNDVRAATFGEWRYGAAKNVQDFVCVFIGTGIGGGIVSGGVLLTGYNNSAGEIGHMITSGQGEKCTCGNRGCWETQAAGWGIAKLTQEAVRKEPSKGLKIVSLADGEIDHISAKHLFQAVIEHDPLAEDLMKKIEKALIDGSTSLVNIFNPELLVFGGGIIDGAPWLIELIEKGVRLQALKSATEKLKILPAQNSKNAAMIGIAIMAKEHEQSYIKNQGIK